MNFSKKNQELRFVVKSTLRKTVLTILALFISIASIAQQGINYKALIKNENGDVVSSQDIEIQFTIEMGGFAVYSETHQITTDINGIAIAVIGTGTVISGDFNTVDWKMREAQLQVQMDLGNGLIDFGTSAFNAVPYALHALNPEGLVAINEGNGVGWRLNTGLDSDNYGNIGQYAIDLSTQIDTGLRGATGLFAFSAGALTLANASYSVAFGEATSATGYGSFSLGTLAVASGDYSFALGNDPVASGDYSVALGNNSRASGFGATAIGRNTNAFGAASVAMGFETEASDYSVAFGYQNEASGAYAAALGYRNVASGEYAVAFGGNSVASGALTTAIGVSTNAAALNSMAIGRFNVGGGTSDLWVLSEPLFEIGNGSGDDNRSNAVTVLKNGNVGIGTSSPQELLHLSGGRLRIGNETIEDGGSDILAFSSSIVPTLDEEDRLGGPNRRWLDVYAANGVIQTSDRRSKTNIAKLNYGLLEVMQMQPVRFNWKNNNNPDAKLGLIAQDLQEIIPEVVQAHIWEKDQVSGVLTKKELDRLGVYYADLVPVLINAIKEQQTIITDLKKHMDLQKNKLTANENRILAQAETLELLLDRMNQMEVNNKE